MRSAVLTVSAMTLSISLSVVVTYLSKRSHTSFFVLQELSAANKTGFTNFTSASIIISENEFETIYQTSTVFPTLPGSINLSPHNPSFLRTGGQFNGRIGPPGIPPAGPGGTGGPGGIVTAPPPGTCI